MHLVDDRKAHGPYVSIYDFIERVNLNAVNKRTIEALALSGGFDDFGLKRNQFFYKENEELTFIESLIRYGNKMQSENVNVPTLFGDSVKIEIALPEPPNCNEWHSLELLNREKDHIGIYLSAHPLDDYKVEIKNFCNTSLSDLQNLAEHKNRDISIAGIVTDVYAGTTKTGKPFGNMFIEDYTDTYKLSFFGKDYIDFGRYCTKGYSLLIKGKVQERPYQNGELEFKITYIELLSDVLERMANTISLKLNIEDINERFIHSTLDIIQQNKGNTVLKFNIIDTENRISLGLFSRTFRVNVNNKLIKSLENLAVVDYKIN